MNLQTDKQTVSKTGLQAMGTMLITAGIGIVTASPDVQTKVIGLGVTLLGVACYWIKYSTK